MSNFLHIPPPPQPVQNSPSGSYIALQAEGNYSLTQAMFSPAPPYLVNTVLIIFLRSYKSNGLILYHLKTEGIEKKAWDRNGLIM